MKPVLQFCVLMFAIFALLDAHDYHWVRFWIWMAAALYSLWLLNVTDDRP